MPLALFHPTVRRWFETRLGTPSEPQAQGWPKIRSGKNTLIAAPTGTGKTLAAFLWTIDELLRQGPELADEARVLYVSPLKALGNDVRKNLHGPLAELASLDPSFPEIRVLVRSGDTPPGERTAMTRRPPHILVTTPESLYILLTSDGGRRMLRTVRTVIVDEIHAVAGDKRGAHLALSLERLEALVGAPLQRIGLSATQKPVEDVARLLVGVDRDCEIVDVGHRRALDLAIEIPESPLETVCSHETWEEIIRRIAELIEGHRTTLVFVNTRKLAERVAARLTSVLGEDSVTSHHGSLSRERRLDAEERLKQGRLRALVATASLELGIDIGDVDLAIQIGITPSIAVFLQRVGRSGHGLGRTPKGRIFPLTRDDLVCAAALVDAVGKGELDRTRQPEAALDILGQQIVAACVPEVWDEGELFARLRRAWPYRELARGDFDSLIALHTEGRTAFLHQDGVHHRLRATRRARIPALTSGGAIPDTGQYRVLVEPEGILVGQLDEDFAIEANGGDIFQLGNASWQILRVEPGVVRVADARGAPPTIPFWLGEGPARTPELARAVSRIRIQATDADTLAGEAGISGAVAAQIAAYIEEGKQGLGVVPTPECVVLERFFDESGGMQLVIHAPFGSRINRAWGLALRKRFCRGFGFELQAAANEEAIVLSLGLQHSFPLDEVFDYLHPDTAKDLLVQALLDAPMFKSRWRWNLTRSLALPRTRPGGERLPTPLLRMRAEDLLAQAFPQTLACPETLPPGDVPVPWEHPIVRQTIEDCLTEAMDVDGFLDLLCGLRDGRIRRLAVDTAEPSAFARGILNAMPYTFLDDAPLEERRTQAVMARRNLDARAADQLGTLDPEAVARVREEAWPDPENAEELHEALLWMGFVTRAEAEESGWLDWLEELRSAGRAFAESPSEDPEGRWFATEKARDPKTLLRGRLEALGPVLVGESGVSLGEDGERWSSLPSIPASQESLLVELEVEGRILRCRLAGRNAWCERRLLARIQRYTLDRLRQEIEPVSAGELWRFLARWQHAEETARLDGPRGVADVIRQLAGFEAPAASWEASILSVRVRGYRPEWLDQLTLTGELAWGRLWGAGNPAIRSTPICILPREDLDLWRTIADRVGSAENGEPLSAYALSILGLLEARGACFTSELERASGLLPSHLEMGLADLIGHGAITCDSFAGLRRLIPAPSRRRGVSRRSPLSPAGRWSRFRVPSPPEPSPVGAAEIEFVARRLLERYGIVFRRLLERERAPIPWRDLVRVYRSWELAGEIRGGRFVQRFAGEQFALAEAVDRMRRWRREGRLKVALETEANGSPSARGLHLHVSAADPLNLEGVLTPEPRVPPGARRRVLVG